MAGRAVTQLGRQRQDYDPTDSSSSSSTPNRLGRILILVAALVAWWFGFRTFAPWVQRAMSFELIADRDVATIVGHWLAWQLPGVIPCLVVWLIGERLGLMPSFIASFFGGGSWSRVFVSGLIATAVLLVLTVGIGAAVGGTFGVHPYGPKMLGDVVSNMYEEMVHRGLLFAAFYGVAAGSTFPLSGPLDRAGLVAGTIGSCFIFAVGHGQYSVGLRVVLGVMSIVFVWPWVRARSLWAPYIPHTLGDVIGDSILKL